MAFNIAAHSRSPDYVRALSGGLQTGMQMRRNIFDEKMRAAELARAHELDAFNKQMKLAELSRQDRLAQIGRAAAGGDKDALATYMGMNPKGGAKIAGTLADEQERIRDFLSSAAATIMQSPTEEGKKELYEMYTDYALENGILEPEDAEPWDENTEAELQQFISAGRKVENIVDQPLEERKVDLRQREVQAREEENKLRRQKLSEREKRINRIMETSGADKDTATGIVDGYLKPTTDPVLGGTSLINLVTGEQTPFKKKADMDIDIPEDEGESLYDKAEYGSGPESALRSFAGTVQGLLTGQISPENQKALDARQEFRLATGGLIRSLSVNDRFPVAEQNRIQKEIDIKPSFFKSPAELRNKLQTIDNFLLKESRKAARDSIDDDLPADVRTAQRNNWKRIENFREQLGAASKDTPEGVPGNVLDAVRAELEKRKGQ